MDTELPEGIGVAESFDLYAADLKAFIETLRERAHGQFVYNHAVNAPRGILPNDPAKLARQAVNSGIVAAIAKREKWSCDAVAQLAADLLEDVNLHDLSAIVRNYEWRTDEFNPFPPAESGAGRS